MKITEVKLVIGDLLYTAHVKLIKLDQRWLLYYRIVEGTGAVSFVIWDQMIDKTKRAMI